MEFVSLPFTAVPSRESQTLGSVNNTQWLLNSTWNRPLIVSGANQGAFMLADLVSLEIKRFGALGLVKIDVLLEPRLDSGEQRVISAYLEKGQSTIGLFPFSHKFNKIPSLKGVIQIFDFINCRISNDGGTQKNIEIFPRGINSPKCIPFRQLSEDFMHMLDHSALADVTLKCGTAEIKVHKCILSARSPVFAAMFRNPMQEDSSGSVDIVDVELSVLQALLRYMYGGRVDHVSDEMAEKLVLAADKYGMTILRNVCIFKLKSALSVGNVFRVLVLGHLLNRDLKDSAKEFIFRCDKFAALESTEEWKSFEEEQPKLALEVLSSFVKHLQSANRLPPFGSSRGYKRKRM